jgi:hypothetical protein
VWRVVWGTAQNKVLSSNKVLAEEDERVGAEEATAQVARL